MFLELINDLLVNSSMFYVYFGMFLVTIGFAQLLFLQHSWGLRKSTCTQSLYISMVPSNLKQMDVYNEPFIIWFGKSCKRMYTTEDDLEDDNASYFIQLCKIRGGSLWEKTTYAPQFININLHASALYL